MFRIYNEKLDNYGHLMTVSTWNECVKDGSFTSSDGFGYWVKNNKSSEDRVFETLRLDATHVIWYNK